METAMGDSQHFDVLSPEEIDSLKKELSNASSRIDSTKRKLILETKLRDATQSINRLYPSTGREGSLDSSTSQKGHLNFGSKGSVFELAGRSDDESREGTRKCEELAQDLWKLEKQEQELSRKLIEHTAAVLQMTHKGYLKAEAAQDDLRNGVGLLDGHDKGDFGDLSRYRPYSQALMSTADSLNVDMGHSSSEFIQQTNMIIDVGKRVEEFNARLRDMIFELKPSKEDLLALPQPPKELKDDPTNAGEILWGQVNFLDQCLDAMHDLQSDLRANPGPARAQAQDLAMDKDTLDIVEEKLEVCNNRLFQIMIDSNPEQASKYTPPPEASGKTIQDQLDYLQGGLGAVGKRLKHLGEVTVSSSEQLEVYQQRAAQYVSTVGNLWDILMEPERNAEQNLRGNPSGQALNGNFSLQAFAIAVKELQGHSSNLKQQKEVLTRQIQQQRELNDTVDSAKDARMNDMREELEHTKNRLQAAEQEMKAHVDRLTIATAELEATKKAIGLRDKQQTMVESQALEKERGRRERAEAEVAHVATQLNEAKAASVTLAASSLALKSELEGKKTAAARAETSLKELEPEVARLQTELTITKAELDGAYGSRAQRAAEKAGDPALLRERESLQARVKDLQRELTETIADYEAMTKATIEYEREREQLESLADSLRDRIEKLESELADEKVQMLGAKSPGVMSNSGGSNSTSAGVLKNEFKKMMRETRAEHVKLLRVCLQLLQFLVPRIM
jgi:hypothetical protein